MSSANLVLPRRSLLAWLSVTPLLPLACSPRPAAAPLAHLHGQDWVHGAYGYYARSYLDIQSSAERRTHDAYRVLAQRGIASLDALQSREVPFFIRVDPASDRFAIERSVPDRLTFTADMSEADRQAATADWKLAREHIHTDYDQIRVLNWALTSLLQQLRRIRGTIDHTREEQFRLTRQLTDLSAGALPFELPYQVTPRDYEHVLYLLLERLDDDSTRLAIMESSIAAVGLTARATDANSGSLAANLDKVLFAVVEDATRSEPRPADYPGDKSKDDELAARGRQIYQRIVASPEYDSWLREDKNRQLQQLGSFLALVDALTGVPASSVYRELVDLWTGNGDYLVYLRAAASFLPGGSSIARTVGDAVDKTDKLRKTASTVRDLVRNGSPPPTVAGLLNTGSRFARSRLERQLVFFENADEARAVRSQLAGTDLLRTPMPDVPR